VSFGEDAVWPAPEPYDGFDTLAGVVWSTFPDYGLARPRWPRRPAARLGQPRGTAPRTARWWSSAATSGTAGDGRRGLGHRPVGRSRPRPRRPWTWSSSSTRTTPACRSGPQG